MSLRVLKEADGTWALYNREWDGIDKPQYDFVRRLKFEEAIELVRSGKARDRDRAVEAAMKNPLAEIAKAAHEGNQ